MIARDHLLLVVIVARDLIGRRQNLGHRRVEPAIDVRADQLAADDEHQHGRHERHAEQQRDELRSEPRKRQRLSPLDDQLDDVASQHEQERHDHCQVRGRQTVEDELAQEVWRKAGRAACRDEQRRKSDEEDDDAGEDQPRVVAERTARRCRRRRLAGATSRRDGRDRCWHKTCYRLWLRADGTTRMDRPSTVCHQPVAISHVTV